MDLIETAEKQGCSRPEVMLVLKPRVVPHYPWEVLSRLYRFEVTEDIGRGARNMLLEALESFDAKDIRIICLDEENQELAAGLREEFQIPGPKREDVRPFRDKVAMKDRWQAAGVKTPKFLKIAFSYADLVRSETYDHIVQVIGSNFVLKPVDGAGAASTYIISNKNEYDAALSMCERNKKYSAEETIVGTMFHADSVAVDNAIVFAEVCLFNKPPLKLVHGETVGALLLTPTNPLRAKLLRLNEGALRALPQFDKVTHLEGFIDNRTGEAIALEVAARPAGAEIVPLLTQATGVSLSEAAFALQAELPYQMTARHMSSGGWVYYPKQPGRIRRAAVQITACASEWMWMVEPGETTVGSTNFADRAAGVVFWEEEREAEQTFKDLCSFEPITYA